MCRRRSSARAVRQRRPRGVDHQPPAGQARGHLGQRSYAVGFEDGRFYANGWHITGEMGGVWAPPIKLVDGVWFGVNGQWTGPATKFTSGWGYTRYELPSLGGLRLARIDFAPGDPAGGVPPNIDRCWTCRSSVMQAWGNYMDWAVVTQQLGVRPFLNYGALQVVPQVPQGQPSVAGSNILLGKGSRDVFASHRANRYVTTMQVHGLHLRSMMIGQMLPLGSSARVVMIDGRRATRVQIRITNRGIEVTVPVSGDGVHTLVITT